MTRDDIIRMAQEAGITYELVVSGWGQHWIDIPVHFERFAALVSAAEREAIAQMIEDAPPLVEFSQNDKGGCMVCGFTPKLASAAIRARSES
jgi:hypothetical protein